MRKPSPYDLSNSPIKKLIKKRKKVSPYDASVNRRKNLNV